MIKYRTANQWRDEAMCRCNGVDEEESAKRREIVRKYQIKAGVNSCEDTLADYELYILGKMEIEEYQQYLVFKHGKEG